MFRDRIGLRTCLSVQGSGFRIYVWFRVSGLGLVESTSPLLDLNCFSVSSPPPCDAHSLALRCSFPDVPFILLGRYLSARLFSLVHTPKLNLQISRAESSTLNP